jgi:hypothetical protein
MANVEIYFTRRDNETNEAELSLLFLCLSHVSALSFKPKILQHKPIIERVREKIKAFINTFIEGMGGVFDCISSGLN